MEKQFTVQTEIYDVKNIQSGIADFCDVAEILFQNNTLIISGEKNEDIDVIFKEFMNYVLSL